MLKEPGLKELVLKDIHTPDAISQFPIAIGWWLLAFLLIGLIIYVAQKHLTNKRKNKDKNTALKTLLANKNMNTDDILLLLKWSAMQYFDRNLIAKLYGPKLQLFLSNQLPDKQVKKFDELTKTAFNQQYQAKHDINAQDHFKEAAILWITNALPPKKNKLQDASSELRKEDKNKLRESSDEVAS